ncbi:hypothetical protein KAH55_08205, partial [bacterium]|nr:hypothetical protein [bacterium]
MAKFGNLNPLPIYREENRYSWRQLLSLVLVFSVYFLILVKTSWQMATILYLALPALVVFGYYLFKIPGLAIGLMISATSLDVMGRIGNTGLTVFHLFFVVSLGIFLVTRLWEGRLSVKVTGIEGLLLVFIIYTTGTLLWSIERMDGLVSVLRLLALLVTMYLTLNLTRNKNSVRLILILTFIPAVLLSAYSGRDFLTSSGVEVKNALSMLKLFSRFGATFENPNYFATFLLFPMCISFAGLAFLKIHLWKKVVLFAIPMGIMAVAFVGTFS